MEKYLIGEIDFSKCDEEEDEELKYTEDGELDYFSMEMPDAVDEVSMATIELDNLGVCKINVYGGEREIPHLHIEPINKDKEKICVNLVEPKYFKHEGKMGSLNSKQKKYFIKFMEAGPTKDTTNWDLAVEYWNKYNKYKISKDTKMPNYRNLH